MTIAQKNSLSRSGFTLVELLVVISIIGILAGIAFPAYQRVQENGKSIKDLNQLRQMGLAMHADAADSDGYLAMLAGDAEGDEDSGGWAKLMRDRHIRDNSVFASPFDRNAEIADDPTGTTDLSYGINAELAEGVMLDQVSYPSLYVAIAPMVGENGVFNTTTIDSAATVSSLSIKAGSHADNKRINALYLDGHVEGMLFEEFIDTNSEAGKRRWNLDND